MRDVIKESNKEMMRVVRESRGRIRRGKGKKAPKEFPDSLLKKMLMFFNFMFELMKGNETKLPVYYECEGEKKRINYKNINDLNVRVLVKIKDLNNVSIDLAEFEKNKPGYYWIKVTYDGLSKAERRRVIKDYKPTIGSKKYNDSLSNYWLVRANSEEDAIKIQNIIAKASGGKGNKKRPLWLIIPDYDYFNDEELLSRGIDTKRDRTYRTRLLNKGEIQIAESIAMDLNVDFIASPLPIKLEVFEPKSLAKSDMPLLINWLTSDMKAHQFGNNESLFLAVACGVSSIVAGRVELSYTDYLGEKKIVNATMSGCIVGRSKGGCAETIELLIRTLGELEKVHEITANDVKKKHNVESQYHDKIEAALMAVAVKKTISANNTDSVNTREFKDAVLRDVHACREGEPELRYSQPLFYTNNLEGVIEEIPNIEYGTMVIPVDTASLLRKSMMNCDVDKELSSLLNRHTYKNVSVLSYLSINQFDDIKNDYESSSAIYSAPIESYDMYICSSNDSLVSRNNELFQEEDVKVLSDQFVALNKYMGSLEGKEPLELQLSKGALLVYDEFEFDLDIMKKLAPEEPWILQQLNSLNTLAYKLALNIACIEAYDIDEGLIEPVEEITTRVMEKATALALYAGENILKLSTSESIDYVNALSVAPKLRLLTTKFTARTLYKDKGWAGVKNNPLRAKGALRVLEKFGWVINIGSTEKADETIITYKTNPALLRDTAESKVSIYDNEIKFGDFKKACIS